MALIFGAAHVVEDGIKVLKIPGLVEIYGRLPF
jgi:hypothetical protein